MNQIPNDADSPNDVPATNATPAANVPAPPASATNGDVLAALMAHTRRAGFERRWRFLQRTDSIRKLRKSPAEVIAALRSAYSDETLLQTRVATSDNDGNILLTPKLVTDSKVEFIFDAQGQATDVVDDNGALMGVGPPFLLSGLERAPRTPRPLDTFVATTSDVQILRSLGFKAMSAAGLANITGAQVRQLLGNQTSTQGPKTRFVVVGCDLTHLDHKLPDYVWNIQARFWRAFNVFNYSEEDIFIDVWRPTASEFKWIRSAVKFADSERVAAKIRRSIDTSTLPIITAWVKLMDETDLSLSDAYARAQFVIAKSHGCIRVEWARVAGARLQRALDQLLPARLLNAATTAACPLEALIWLELEKLARELISIDPALAKLECIAQGIPATANADDEDERALHRDQVLDRILSLTKQLTLGAKGRSA